MPPNTPIGPLVLTLRSASDPMLAVSKLTRGSMHFGRTKKEEQQQAKGMVILGMLSSLVPVMYILHFALEQSLASWPLRATQAPMGSSSPLRPSLGGTTAS